MVLEKKTVAVRGFGLSRTRNKCVDAEFASCRVSTALNRGNGVCMRVCVCVCRVERHSGLREQKRDFEIIEKQNRETQDCG